MINGDAIQRPKYNIPEDAEVADPPTPGRARFGSPDQAAGPAPLLQVSDTPLEAGSKVRTISSASSRRSSKDSTPSFTLPPNSLIGMGSGHVASVSDDSKFEFYNARSSRKNSLSVEAPEVRGPVRGSTSKNSLAESKNASDDTNMLKPRKSLKIWNSTSSLFVKTTMSKPDVSRSVRCMSSIIYNRIDRTVKTDEGWNDFEEPDDYYSSRMPDDKHALYRYILNIYTDAQLTIECLVMALIYMDRMLEKLKLKLSPRNLRPCVLCSLMLASKVWDDVSMWNADFCEIYPRFPLWLLNQWERKLLVGLGFDVTVSANEYAKYYFNLREEEIKMNGGLETDLVIKPLSPTEADKLEMKLKSAGFGSSGTRLRERALTESFDENEESKERVVLS